MLGAVQSAASNREDVSQEWYPHFNVFVKDTSSDSGITRVGYLDESGPVWAEEEVTKRLLNKTPDELMILYQSGDGERAIVAQW